MGHPEVAQADSISGAPSHRAGRSGGGTTALGWRSRRSRVRTGSNPGPDRRRSSRTSRRHRSGPAHP
eukprot:10154617-Prorocentrum_lima.AAC.1